MLLRLSLLAFCFLAVHCLEQVPHASGIKAAKTPAASKNIRRAPIPPAEGLSLVPHAHRMSTGVRRAPNGATVPQTKLAPRPAVKLVRPSAPAVPMIPLLPLQLPLLNLFPQQQGRPAVGQAAAIPTLSPLAFPTLPPLPSIHGALPTLPPAPGGPITLATMPTMPGLTMPPSFQRLLGMTTPSPAPERTERREETRYQREEKVYDDERVMKSKKKGLSTVSSRLPKYVDNEDDIVAPEKNADWIVPF